MLTCKTFCSAPILSVGLSICRVLQNKILQYRYFSEDRPDVPYLTVTIWPKLSHIPLAWAMNTAATASYKAVPSILIVAPIGRTNLLHKTWCIDMDLIDIHAFPLFVILSLLEKRVCRSLLCLDYFKYPLFSDGCPSCFQCTRNLSKNIPTSMFWVFSKKILTRFQVQVQLLRA